MLMIIIMGKEVTMERTEVKTYTWPRNHQQPHHHHDDHGDDHDDHDDDHVGQEVVIRLWMGEAGVVVQSLQQAGHQPAFR